jgi:dimeric dUTPase (all-alpha-NTP-PPase superfamily)
MSELQEQFTLMLRLQNSMNTKVHPQWIEQGYAYYRALWLECGELIDHYGYKWWKKQVPDMEQVQLEIVDIWHFGLSMLLDGRDEAEIAAEMCVSLDGAQIAELGVLEAAEALALDTLDRKAFSVPVFWSLLQSADMDADSLCRSYVGKNVLYFFRQDNGSKEGTYRKQWQGREDNEHLVEILAELDASAAGFENNVYDALSTRYAQTEEA